MLEVEALARRKRALPPLLVSRVKGEVDTLTRLLDRGAQLLHRQGGRESSLLLLLVLRDGGGVDSCVLLLDGHQLIQLGHVDELRAQRSFQLKNK